jgi:Reverse transcriptase (RNA-dependent DNA polymerase)
LGHGTGVQVNLKGIATTLTSDINNSTVADLRGDFTNEQLVLCNMCNVNQRIYTNNNIDEYIDSGCSDCMSGSSKRLRDLRLLTNAKSIIGFDNSSSTAETAGINRDNKSTLFVPGMPENRDLLSANKYAEDGAVVLLGDEGYIVNMNETEKKSFKDQLTNMTVTHVLKVKNRTYLIDYRVGQSGTENTVNSDFTSPVGLSAVIGGQNVIIDYDINDEDEDYVLESAKCNAYMADLYKNGRVNYSNTDELIMGMYVGGLSPSALRKAILTGSIRGLHPKLTIEALNKFERDHGRSPDLLQMAIYDHQQHHKTYDKEKIILTHCGQEISTDNMFSDYNEGSIQEDIDGRAMSKQVRKLATHGGAVFGSITIDHYSGFVTGILGKPETKSIDLVNSILDIYETCKHPVQLLVADCGIVSDNRFRVLTPAVLQVLTKRLVRYKKVMPGDRNHSIGGNFVENQIRYIKRKMRLAMIYIMSNPNINHLTYTDNDLLKLWGEIFLWACLVVNFGPSYCNPNITRWEAFTGRAPNLQTIRLLPIFAILLVNTGEVYEYGIYCGPHYLGPHVEITPGAIRACVKSKGGQITIYTTQDYKCVSEGYGIDISPHIDRGLIELMRNLAETITSNNSDSSITQTPTTIIPDIAGVDQPITIMEPTPTTETATNELEQIRDSAISTTIIPFKSRRLNQQLPEYVPAYTPARGLSLKDGKLSTNLVQNQSDSELRGDVAHSIEEVNGLLSLEEVCFFTDTLDTTVVLNKLTDRKLSSHAKARLNKKIAKQQLLDDAEANSNIYYPPERKSKGMKNGKNSVSLMAYTEIDIEEWKSVADECGYGEPTIAYKAHLARGDCDTLFYMSYDNGAILQISEATDYDNSTVKEVITKDDVLGFKAVSGPKSFTLAKKDPKWAVPALLEESTITEGPMVLISKEIADEAIKAGANLLNIFPVYEEKEKEGKTVYKVRLVIDGSKHTNHGQTYAETPTRDEFRIFVHIIAHYDWEFYHVDEKRAFLSATHTGPRVIARLEKQFYEVLGALYGLKSAPRDYQQTVIDRLVNKMGYKRFGMCSCIYCKKDEKTGHIIFVFDFVDDFVWSGPDSTTTLSGIDAYKMYADTTPTIVNPTKVLGMELSRNRKDRTITLSLNTKIEEMMEYVRSRGMLERYKLSESRFPRIPMALEQVIIGDDEFEDSDDPFLSSLCDKEAVTEYLTLVGGHLWQLGVRWDVLYAVLYLSWQTHKPRHHHMRCAVRLVMYLYDTRETNKLVLGGRDDIKIITYTDMSLNTGPNGKSVIGYGTRLGEKAGLVSAKCKATVDVVLSSFEGELEGVDYGQENNSKIAKSYMISGLTEGFKQAAGIQNILMELNQEPIERRIYSDNLAMVKFVNGEAQGKGMKHAALRLWYMRQQVDRGYSLEWMAGADILADPMTKAVRRELQEKHVWDVLGHGLRSAAEESEEKLEE